MTSMRKAFQFPQANGQRKRRERKKTAVGQLESKHTQGHVSFSHPVVGCMTGKINIQLFYSCTSSSIYLLNYLDKLYNLFIFMKNKKRAVK